MQGTLVTLREPATGTSARVLAGFGFNCFEFRVRRANRPPVDVLWSEADFASGRKRPSGSGIPILFPFPGRIPGTTFRWQGRQYRLEEGDGRGNAIHGFLLNRPWRVIEQTSSAVAGQFQASQDDPDLLDRWPADFRITVRYALSETALESHIVVDNPSDKPLPCGLGTHPYFRLPLGGGSAGDCVVRLPVNQQWELREMLPTGNRSAVAAAREYQSGLKFADMQFDNVFTGLQFEGKHCQPSIHDPDGGVTVTLAFDRAFRECVVYTPPHREAICIEPYTCLPGGFALEGVDTGVRVLPPGASFEARVTVRVS